ncbi:MAG: DUF1566 domain-containing protein [Gammaproteobacteria bacterium]|nr:DUF1566 domain-containing protein [Gammaproteobacteria bacterium]
MTFKSVLNLIAVCLFVSSFSSNAALIGRDLDGNNTTAEAYYDNILNITWLENANVNEPDDWNNQVAWAAGLNIGGITNWRLPDMDLDADGTVVNCSSGTQADCMDNEYGHLYYYGADTTLGNGITPGTPDPFSNLQSGFYWSGTPTTDLNTAWGFRFDNGQVLANARTEINYAWAVHDGIVGSAVIPIPAAVWLFGSGLICLIGAARKKKG